MGTYAELVAETTTTIRDCLNDHGISVSEAAEIGGITAAEMERQLKTGDLSATHCYYLYRRTGDRRALGWK